MTLYLDSTALCSDASRADDGSPSGPADLSISESPGVELRQLVGADRVKGEYIRCNHGSVSFRVTRTFQTPAAAAAYALLGIRSEPVAGVFKADSSVIFQNAVVSRRQVGMTGCSVAVIYTIEG